MTNTFQQPPVNLKTIIYFLFSISFQWKVFRTVYSQTFTIFRRIFYQLNSFGRQFLQGILFWWICITKPDQTPSSYHEVFIVSELRKTFFITQNIQCVLRNVWTFQLSLCVVFLLLNHSFDVIFRTDRIIHRNVALVSIFDGGRYSFLFRFNRTLFLLNILWRSRLVPVLFLERRFFYTTHICVKARKNLVKIFWNRLKRQIKDNEAFDVMRSIQSALDAIILSFIITKVTRIRKRRYLNEPRCSP